MNKTDMRIWGFSGRFLAEANSYPDFYVGRVISQHKDLYKVVCENGEMLAEVSGKFSFNTAALSDYPAVGDFVMLDRNVSTNGNAIIHHLLSRKSAFVRKAAGKSNDNQVVASNIDTVFICMSLNNDFNLRRLERYLSIAWDSGALPVVVLTKSDLCEDVDGMLSEVFSVAVGVDVIVTTSRGENGYSAAKDYLKQEKTIAVIGSSGVGKSTLINCLLGESRLDTKGLRNDDKGRHTTTKRELILIEGSGMIIDTPGMREIGIESADLSKSFADIDELAAMCRFSDCSHADEPGCAVQNAIACGEISEDRLSSYLKLKKEARYDGLNSRQIETEKLNELFKEVGGMKKARKFIKNSTRKR